MPRQLALILAFAVFGWLLYRDTRWRRFSSKALWIPAIWLALASSREPAYWLGVIGLSVSRSRLEGSPVNVMFVGALILMGLVVLQRRHFNWGKFASANVAFFLLLGYFLASTMWSAFPMPTIRSVIQNLGAVVVALVVLTEEDPVAAFRIVVARVSFLLFPLSIALFKYFPEIGRTVSLVSGNVMYSGVTDHKNSLGQMTMVFCLILLWELLQFRKEDTPPRGKPDVFGRLINVAMGVYLLIISDSATALAISIAGFVLLLAGKRLARMKNVGKIFSAAVILLLAVVALQLGFGIWNTILEALNRDMTLTGRTDIWDLTLARVGKPIFGYGLNAWWDTATGISVYVDIGMNRLNTAHNGYIETYLNGGLVGVALLVGFILSAGSHATKKLVRGDHLGRVSVLFWVLILVNNVSESVFFIPCPLWFVMLLVTFDCPWLGDYEPQYAGSSMATEQESGTWPDVAAGLPGRPLGGSDS